MHTRSALLCCLPLVLVLATPAVSRASVISFTGNLPGGDPSSGNVLLPFTLTNPGDIVLQTFGYGGGTNAAGDAIPAGGFMPVVLVYDAAGVLVLDSVIGSTSGCGPANVDADGFCGDLRMSYADSFGTPAAAGTYRLAVLAFGNAPISTLLADGFSGTGSLFGNDGAMRSAHFAVDVTAPMDQASTPVPEPATLFLAATGLAAMRARAARRR